MQDFKLNIIDEIIIKQGVHYYLDASDTCAYLGEYVSGGGFSASETNKLISNFKILPTEIAKRGKFKKEATEFFAKILVSLISKNWLQTTTFVPIPPSKTKENPNFDDRVVRLLHEMELFAGLKLDIRNCIIQRNSTDADHASNAKRLNPEERISLYDFDSHFQQPFPAHITIIDDIITTGSHFKSIKSLLMKAFPEVKIYGLFLARRIQAE